MSANFCAIFVLTRVHQYTPRRVRGSPPTSTNFPDLFANSSLSAAKAHWLQKQYSTVTR
ncbi:MAG: hypothetical protein H7Z75_13475 [Ferruginibacter sp.]|nr:hypothetical protein [Cytophagales bacterium]